MNQPMDDLIVETEHLKTLSTVQNQTALKEAAAAAAATNLSTSVWVSHGVISGASNVAFTKAADARRHAGEALQGASSQTADNLVTAKNLYEKMDEQAAANINKQIITE
jgi:hypothetical protein